ncbi:hypothetical protein [Desulfitobacterium sp. AusDCA]|uniref:hypothetical protein n=1 Tax=Desulfitobacterium sp. AusDCA TaxID=3240383 RepID=UPI003DA6E562
MKNGGGKGRFTNIQLAVRVAFESRTHVRIASTMKNSGLGVGIPEIGRVKLKVENGKVIFLTAIAFISQPGHSAVPDRL